MSHFTTRMHDAAFSNFVKRYLQDLLTCVFDPVICGDSYDQYSWQTKLYQYVEGMVDKDVERYEE